LYRRIPLEFYGPSGVSYALFPTSVAISF
jgi:hypothetical protein